MYIRKLPSGNYNVMAYAGKDLVSGKRILKSFTGPDLKKLKAEAAAWEYEYKNAISGGSFGESALRCFSSNKSVLSPATQRGYNAIINYLKTQHWFWRTPCHQITSATLQKLIDKMPAAPKTISNRMAFVSSVLKYAGYNPPAYKLPQIPVPDLHIPDTDTVKKTIDAAEGELWICIMLAATGPLRAGEICALTLSDIDFKTNMVHVHHSVSRGLDNTFHVKPPKTTASDRHIVLPRPVIAAIKRQGFVTHWNPNGLANAFKRHLKRNGIPHYRFHDLRHYCISELLSQGVEEIYIAERSGHSDYSTLKKYTHVLTNHRKKINKIVLSHFSELTG